MIFNFATVKSTRYGDYVFPWYMDGLGWCMTLLTVSCIPAVAIYKVCTADPTLTLKERVSENWCPGGEITEKIGL